jgi:Fe2+ transport system protein FeoA
MRGGVLPELRLSHGQRVSVRDRGLAAAGLDQVQSSAGDRPGENGMTLRHLRPGETAEVMDITSTDAGRLMKLGAYGLAPGSLIRLEQHSPVCIVWVGETQLSLDQQVADEILVCP